MVSKDERHVGAPPLHTPYSLTSIFEVRNSEILSNRRRFCTGDKLYEVYPTDANLFGTLGDFYEKSGRREHAVDAYKRALAIDPNFEKAKAALKTFP